MFENEAYQSMTQEHPQGPANKYGGAEPPQQCEPHDGCLRESQKKTDHLRRTMLLAPERDVAVREGSLRGFDIGLPEPGHNAVPVVGRDVVAGHKAAVILVRAEVDKHVGLASLDLL